MDNPDEKYVNIRDLIGQFVGLTIVDITQHDKSEFDADGGSYVCLMFNNGNMLKFPIGDDGFQYYDDDGEEEQSDKTI